MKANIHPNYVDAVVKCACGETFKTRSTKPEIHLEICSKCHPFFTGKQKLVDTAGRVERFQRKYAKKALRSTHLDLPILQTLRPHCNVMGAELPATTSSSAARPSSKAS